MDIEKIKMGLENFKKTRIVVFGDVMLDEHIYGKTERISPEAPVLVVKKEYCTYGPGGTANVARNIKTLGGNVELVSVIGGDSTGEILKKKLRDLKISTDYLIIDEKRPTPTKTRIIAQKQQVVRIDNEIIKDMENESEIEEIAKNLIPGADVVVISDYGKGVVTKNLVNSIVAISKKYGKKTIADPKDYFSKYKNVDLITPNTKELEKFSEMKIENYDDMISVARMTIYKNGIQNVLVTRGEDGMTLVSKDHTIDIPAINEKGFDVVDVSGAGDTVVALLALGMASGLSLEESATISNYGAGIVVRKSGVADVTVSELEEELEKSEIMSVRKKIKTIVELEKILKRHRERGRKIVSTNGCFDIIHTGHIKHLEDVKKLGDILIVGINSDESVKRLKGHDRPINSLKDRMEVIASLNLVDYVFSFDEDDPRVWLDRLKPDIHAKGAGYTEESLIEKDIVESYGGRIVILQKHGEKSSSSIISKIKSTEKNRAVFLDRDGVINKDLGTWITNEDDFIFLPKAKEAIKKLKQAGYKIIVITNQSGIGNGALTLTDLDRIHGKMIKDLKEYGIAIDGIYFCPHIEKDNCSCRKPKTGMLENAIEDQEIDAKESFFVGDAARDVEAGKRIGCTTIYVRSEKKEEADSDFTVDDLYEAADIILKEKPFKNLSIS